MKDNPFANMKWVFFDLGNTLIDETCARRHLLKQIVIRLSHKGFTTAPERIELALAAAVARFCPEPWESALEGFVADVGQACQLLQDISYPKHLEQTYPATPSLLAGLEHNGFRLGVLANQSLGTERRLGEYGIGHHFSCCLSSAEVGFAKPDMKLFRLAEEAAGCSGRELLMIGDRLDNDIRPARARGWATIRVKQGLAAAQQPRDSLDEPDASCSDLADVVALLGASATKCSPQR